MTTDASGPALRSAVAKLLRIEPDALAPGQSLREFRSSIRRMVLETAVSRALNRPPAPLPELATYGDLERFLLGSSPNSDGAAVSSTPARAPIIESNASATLAVGIDLEAVSSLPDADDYWDHEFYARVFTDREIAYCRLQAQPKIHFAARWCAKEALRKCDPRFAGLDQDPKAAEVGHLEDGSPILLATIDPTQPRRRLPHSLSLSHAEDFAIAVVAIGRETAPLPNVNVNGNAAPASLEPIAISATTAETRSRSPSPWLGRLALLMSLAALALSAWTWQRLN